MASHLKLIAKQVHALVSNPPDGIANVQASEGYDTISAEITGPVDTPFEGGVFKCTLVMDEDFPVKPPKGYFSTKIFHPNVSAEGEICVNTLKRDWDPKKWSFGHILGVIKCLLIVPFPESSLNDEAGKLFMEDYEEYFQQATLMTRIHARAGPKVLEQKQPERVEEPAFGKESAPL